jgi:ubiquinone/menaquinone biosynthesis C-methylase UbiE
MARYQAIFRQDWFYIMFANPEENVARLHLKEGEKVADFGAGTGAYAIAAGKKVGGDGKVYAVEVQDTLLPRIANMARDAGLSNIKPLWGDIEEVGGTAIPDQSLDAVILSNVLFQVGDKKGLLAEASRVLKRGGRVLCIEWKDSFNNLGPSPDAVVSSGAAEEYFVRSGFHEKERFDAGSHHYGFIFEK